MTANLIGCPGIGFSLPSVCQLCLSGMNSCLAWQSCRLQPRPSAPHGTTAGLLAPVIDLLTASLTRRYVTMEAEGMKRVREVGSAATAAKPGPGLDQRLHGTLAC